MIEISDSENGLYDSHKDIGTETEKIFEPVFDEGVEYSIDAPPVTSAPEYQPTSNLITTKTVIPTGINYNIPDVTQFPDSEVFQVDIQKLTKTYSEELSSKILENVQNNIPIPEEVAETLVTKQIIVPVSPVKIAPPAVEIYKNTDLEPETPVIKKPIKKVSFIDNIVNTLYNLIF